MAEWAKALADGLGAAANTGAGMIGDQMKLDQNAQAEQRAADIKLDLAQRMAASEEMMKARAVERFQNARQGIVNQKLGQKYGQTDTAVADAAAGNTDAPLTPEQQQAIAQAKGIDANRLNGDQDVLVQAGLTSGTISPEQAAQLTNKSDLAQMKMDQYAQSVQAKLEAANNRTEMMGAIAQLRVDAAKNSGSADGKLPSDAKMIDYLVAGGMDKKTATDRVMGTGAGATKDPVAMATSLASSMISSGVISKKKGEDENDFLKRAMSAATGQIQSAESMFRPGGAAPAPAPVAAGGTVPNPVAATRPPLSSFRK